MTYGIRALKSNSQKLAHFSMIRYADLKPVIDRILAFVSLLVLSPIFILIALCVVIDSPGGAFFRQERVGKDGKRFTIYKFRSMKINNDDSKYRSYIKRYILHNASYNLNQNGQRIYKVDDDSQVTRFGTLLRKTNLDELPQLINVFKGEMSFVGPRPDVPFAVDIYKDWHRKRLRVIPGITGLWQVCGRKHLPFEGMVRLDIFYINKRSFFLDIKILLLTIGTILRRDGS